MKLKSLFKIFILRLSSLASDVNDAHCHTSYKEYVKRRNRECYDEIKIREND